MKHIFLALIFTLVTQSAWAYYAILDNGEVLAANHFKLTADLQALTDQGGLNGAARFDMGFKDEFGARVLLGGGTTDLFFGALFKWMPIPDIQGQPAIGFNAGILYAHASGNRDTTFRLEPLVSKKFSIDGLDWTPYASLPIGLRSRDNADVSNRSDVTWQLVGGTQLQIPRWKNLQFIGEFGVDLGNALSHVSIGAILYVDSEKGFVIE